MDELKSEIKNKKGRENKDIGINEGWNIGDGNKGFRMIVGSKCEGKEEWLDMDKKIVRIKVKIGKIRKIEGNIKKDKVRKVRKKRIRWKKKKRWRERWKVLKKKIRFRKEIMKNEYGIRVFKINRKDIIGKVEKEKMWRNKIEEIIIGEGEIEEKRKIEIDEEWEKIGKMESGERGRYGVLKREESYKVEREEGDLWRMEWEGWSNGVYDKDWKFEWWKYKIF